MTLTNLQARRARKMDRQGIPRTMIAKILHVRYATVRDALGGYIKPPLAGEYGKKRVDAFNTNRGRYMLAEDFESPDGNRVLALEPCEGCGAVVLKPCVKCALEALEQMRRIHWEAIGPLHVIRSPGLTIYLKDRPGEGWELSTIPAGFVLNQIIKGDKGQAKRMAVALVRQAVERLAKFWLREGTQ